MPLLSPPTPPRPPGRAHTTFHWAVRMIVFSGIIALILVGCGGTTSTESASSPAAGSDVPEDAAVNSDLGAMLDELPVPPGASVDGDPTVASQTIEQTWTIQGQDVESVFTEVYQPELDDADWTTSSELVREGSGWSESWERDGATLTIVSEAGQDTTDITTNVLLTAADPSE